MQTSFAALMPGFANGDAMEMAQAAAEFGLTLAAVEEYARSVLGKSANA